MTKTESLTENQVAILRERWVHYRTEALQMLQNRLKTVQISIASMAAIVAAASAMNKPEIAFAGILFSLAGMNIFSGQRFMLNLLSAYLFKIERTLDEGFNMPVKGWEFHFRKKIGFATDDPMIKVIFFSGLGVTAFALTGIVDTTYRLLAGVVAILIQSIFYFYVIRQNATENLGMLDKDILQKDYT